MAAIVRKKKTPPIVAKRSNGENVLNIQALASNVQQLQNSVDCWNNVGVFFLFLTALIAVGYFVVSRIAINTASQLRMAQITLADAQDRQLKYDLKEKDLMIAKLQAKNLEIVRAIIPRTVAITYPTPLEQFSDVKFEIVAYTDAETQRFAKLLYEMLIAAKWKPTTLNITAPSSFAPGITVEYGAPIPKDPSAYKTRSRIGAMALIDHLKAEHIDASLGGRLIEVNTDEIRIIVGPHGISHALMADLIEEMKKRAEEWQKQVGWPTRTEPSVPNK